MKFASGTTEDLRAVKSHFQLKFSLSVAPFSLFTHRLSLREVISGCAIVTFLQSSELREKRLFPASFSEKIT